MMPIWQSASETWVQRMLEELDGDLSAVVAWDTNGQQKWKGSVRAISLSPSSRALRYYYRFAHKATSTSESIAHMILLREISRRGVKRILCHYGEFAVNFMSVWNRVNVPLYVHFHGYDATFDLRLTDHPDKKYFNDNYRNNLLELAGRATFIANSKFTKSLLKDAGIPSENIFVKYLGVPVPSSPKKHIFTEEINVLHLGRLADCKSPDRTIKAFEIAREKGMKGTLVIAGDGPLRVTCELLKKRSPYRGSIQILGAVTVDHAKKLLSNADIYTQHNITGEITRQSEGFGISVIEAMAEGLPVVCTRSGGINETVVDGKTGILVTPGDIEGQADAIFRLSMDVSLRQKLGFEGHKRVLDNFSMEQEARRLRMIMQL